MLDAKKSFTFHHSALCLACGNGRTTGKTVYLPVEKTVQDIIDASGKDRAPAIVEKIEGHFRDNPKAIIAWPSNPSSEEEVEQFMKGKKCPQGHPLRTLDFIWPLGAG